MEKAKGVLPNCPVEVTLQLIGNKWKVLILRELLNGEKRFGVLRKAISGISPKVLTGNLRQMEEDGLVNRKIFPEVPPRVEYNLTDTGYSLEIVLDALKDWGEGYVNGPESDRSEIGTVERPLADRNVLTQ